MSKIFSLIFCLFLLSACDAQQANTDAAGSAQNDTSETKAVSTERITVKATSSPTVEAKSHMPLSIDPVLVNDVTQQLKVLQKKLPQKTKEGLTITSVRRKNQFIYYSFTSFDTKLNSQNFHADKIKKKFISKLCRYSETKRILLGGFNFSYIYRFQDQSQTTVTITAKDCH